MHYIYSVLNVMMGNTAFLDLDEFPSMDMYI